MIELKNVSYKILVDGEEKVLLDNISCVFEDRCITAITGHNGSGKSTLTKIIMGLIRPTNGRVYFNNIDITDKSIDERARMGINYAFQSPIAFKGITVKDLIDIATNEENGVSKACEVLSKVGICAKEYLDRDFDNSLSGGEQKRIELALALAKTGECYIFDEPEAGIDMWSFDKLGELFSKDKAYIVVSHQEKLLNISDKLLVLSNGKIERFGDTLDVLKSLKPMRCARIEGGNREDR